MTPFRVLLSSAIILPISLLLAAKSDTGNVRINIREVDALDVSDPGVISMDGVSGSNIFNGTSASPGKLNYSHNGPKTKKISAEVRPAGNPSGHDISLTINVAGGAGIQTILSNGNIQGAKTVLSGITPGKVTDKDVQYAATCTTDGTPLDTDTDFVIRVTFTTTE
ncbi:MAG: hypothetical protein QGF00_01980 [Planctomycetota bacterium]|jgi:hypothetical protein|nr:hypothetical protein [Planctomycetota bacterium]